MINSQKNTAIQAVPLTYDKINKGPGAYSCANVIHAETDISLLLHFTEGDVAYDMIVGADRAYRGSFTVVTGIVTYN